MKLCESVVAWHSKLSGYMAPRRGLRCAKLDPMGLVPRVRVICSQKAQDPVPSSLGSQIHSDLPCRPTRQLKRPSEVSF